MGKSTKKRAAKAPRKSAAAPGGAPSGPSAQEARRLARLGLTPEDARQREWRRARLTHARNGAP